MGKTSTLNQFKKNDKLRQYPKTTAPVTKEGKGTVNIVNIDKNHR